MDAVEEWVTHLDFDAPAVKSIVVKVAGGIALKAAHLYVLFAEQTKEPVTLSAFGMRLRDLSMNPSFPLDQKVKKEAGLVYPVRQKK